MIGSNLQKKYKFKSFAAAGLSLENTRTLSTLRQARPSSKALYPPHQKGLEFVWEGPFASQTGNGRGIGMISCVYHLAPGKAILLVSVINIYSDGMKSRLSCIACVCYLNSADTRPKGIS